MEDYADKLNEICQFDEELNERAKEARIRLNAVAEGLKGVQVAAHAFPDSAPDLYYNPQEGLTFRDGKSRISYDALLRRDALKAASMIPQLLDNMHAQAQAELKDADRRRETCGG